MSKKLSLQIIIVFIGILLIEPIINGLYVLVLGDTFVIYSPLQKLSKYLAVIIAIFWIVPKFIKKLERFKTLFKSVCILSFTGIVLISFWFVSANENGLRTQRILNIETSSWEDIEYISISAARSKHIKIFGLPIKITKNKENKSSDTLNRYRPNNPDLMYEYRIHFRDGYNVDIWNEDIDSIYNLHKYLSNHNVNVKYGEISASYDSVGIYVDKEQRDKIRFILGLHEEIK